MSSIRLGTVGNAAIAALLIVGLLVGVTASASSNGGPTASAAKCGKKKGKKKKGKAGADAAKKKKGGCKKRMKPAAVLSVAPASFNYPVTQHQSAPCAPCPSQAFTVTNTGGSASGAPSASITEVTQPVIGAHDPGYFITAKTCTASLKPGATCSVTVQFIPPSNAGDASYTSVLRVTASPGGAAQASLSGVAD